VVLLLAVSEGKLDELPIETIDELRSDLGSWLEMKCPRAAARITSSGELLEEDRKDLLSALDSYVQRKRPNPVGGQ
jgi:hypothetical protein